MKVTDVIEAIGAGIIIAVIGLGGGLLLGIGLAELMMWVMK